MDLDESQEAREDREALPERGTCKCKLAGGNPTLEGLKCPHGSSAGCKLELGEHPPAWWLHENAGAKWPGPDGSRPADAEREVGQIHIAGPDLRVGTVQRQRCAWCGALILEHDLANMARPLEPGEDPDTAVLDPAVWPAGALVLVQGTWPVMTTTVEPVELPDDPDSPEGAFAIPPNSCMAFEPDVSR